MGSLDGRRRGWKCNVGGEEEEPLTAAPQARDGSIQDAPGPGPP